MQHHTDAQHQSSASLAITQTVNDMAAVLLATRSASGRYASHKGVSWVAAAAFTGRNVHRWPCSRTRNHSFAR